MDKAHRISVFLIYQSNKKSSAYAELFFYLASPGRLELPQPAPEAGTLSN